MAPTGAVEVLQLSFNELVGHLVAAHEREVIDLRSQIKQLRDGKDDASSEGLSCDASGTGSLENSDCGQSGGQPKQPWFPSRQPTQGDTEDFVPFPEDTEALSEACVPEVPEAWQLEKSEELPRVRCRLDQPDHLASCIRSRIGPDAKALACALKVAQTLGLDSISEDHMHGFEKEAELLFSEAASSGHDARSVNSEVHSETSAKSDVSLDQACQASPSTSQARESQSSLRLPQVTPTKKKAVPIDDDEPLPEEDKSGSRSGSTMVVQKTTCVSIDAQVESLSGKSPKGRCHGSSSSSSYSARASTDCQMVGREWSMLSEAEKTGDVVGPPPTINMTRTFTGSLEQDPGLSLSSAIWNEMTDGLGGRRSASFASVTASTEPINSTLEDIELTDNVPCDREDGFVENVVPCEKLCRNPRYPRGSLAALTRHI